MVQDIPITTVQFGVHRAESLNTAVALEHTLPSLVVGDALLLLHSAGLVTGRRILQEMVQLKLAIT